MSYGNDPEARAIELRCERQWRRGESTARRDYICSGDQTGQSSTEAVERCRPGARRLRRVPFSGLLCVACVHRLQLLGRDEVCRHIECDSTILGNV